MENATASLGAMGATGSARWYDSLNTRWHKAGLQTFMVVVALHWVEHLVQAWQAFVLHWSRPMSMGLLGLYYPWLMKSEVLHYGFAVVMLVFLWVLRKGFTGRSHTWWMISFWLQFWHHIEHGLLFYQAQTGQYLFGGTVPTSIGQIWIPRIELHLIYNTLVFVPMMVAMYYHMNPPAGEAAVPKCTCARHGAVYQTMTA
jgi:hypothetical protein